MATNKVGTEEQQLVIICDGAQNCGRSNKILAGAVGVNQAAYKHSRE